MIRPYRSLAPLFFLLTPICSLATVVDSVHQAAESALGSSERYDVWATAAKSQERLNDSLAIVWWQKACAEAREMDTPAQIAQSAYALGRQYWNQDSMALALEQFKIAAVTDPADPELANKSKVFLGRVLHQVGDNVAAMEYFLEGAAYWEESGNKEELASTKISIGNLLSVLEEYIQARNRFREALEIGKELKDSVLIMRGHGSLATGFELGKLYDSALVHYGHALTYAEALGLEMAVAGTYNNMAVLYEDQGQHDLALDYLYKGLETVERMGDPYGMALFYQNIGDNQRALEQWEAAGVSYEKGLEKAYAIDHYLLITNLLSDISKVYEHLEDWENAYWSRKKYSILTDSVFNEQQVETVLEMEAKFQNEQKRKDIELLNRQNELQAFRQNALIGILALVLIIVAMVVSWLVSKRKRDRRLHESEIQSAKLREEALERDLQFRSQQLTSYTLQLNQKNERIQKIEAMVGEIRSLSQEDEVSVQLDQLKRNLAVDRNLDRDWNEFTLYFEQVHPKFFPQLKEQFPSVTGNDLRLCALLRLNLSTREIANILGQNTKTVEMGRYRLRKKMGLNREDNLIDVMLRVG